MKLEEHFRFFVRPRRALAGEKIISQLRDRAATGELSSSEIAALIESATTVSKVLAGFDLR